jgi:hypothetical protein
MQRILPLTACLAFLSLAAGANADADKPVFMFVQVADSGSLVPKDGSPGQYLLTLNGVAPQTVYFSDRPLRIAGHVTTDSFLKGLGFSDTNPPNAAVAVDYAAQDEDTIIVELRHPVYNIAKATLQYDVKILTDARGGLAFYAEKRDDKLPKEFSSASLFIDDCPSATIWCNGGMPEKSCGTFQTNQTCFKTVQTEVGSIGGCALCGDAIALCQKQFPTCCPAGTPCGAGSQVNSAMPPPEPIVVGIVTAIGATQWTIGTTTVAVNAQTFIPVPVKVGDSVVCTVRMIGGTRTAAMIGKK